MKTFKTILNELKIEKPHEINTLGIKRKDMPQIEDNDMGDFLKFLDDSGIEYSKETIDPNLLLATQKEFSEKGIMKSLNSIKKRGKKYRKPSIVSRDNYIADGHHRWLASVNGGRRDYPIYRVDLPIKKLLKIMFKFPKTIRKSNTNKKIK